MSFFPYAFFLNLTVEALVLLVGIGVRHWKRILPMALLLNLATHPLFWFLFPQLPGPWLEKMIIGEALVFVTEMTLAILLFRSQFSRVRVLAVVFCANLVTFLMTFIV